MMFVTRDADWWVSRLNTTLRAKSADGIRRMLATFSGSSELAFFGWGYFHSINNAFDSADHAHRTENHPSLCLLN